MLKRSKSGPVVCGLVRGAVVLCALLASLLGSRAASAQDSPPYLLTEPAQYTNVADAFGENDPLDVNVHVGFSRSARSGMLQREASAANGSTSWVDVARSRQVVTSLDLALDVGIYRDLMIYGRLPLVLSDTRGLRLPAGARTAVSDALNNPPPGSTSAPLFGTDLPLDSKTRSGVPAVDFGIAWGITNQYRMPHLPTWMLALEGRFGIGALLHACRQDQTCDPGISRGTTRVKLESRWSYRYRYLEPYAGLSYAIEWATYGQRLFTPVGNLPGYVDATPPHVAEATVGMELVPWEARGRFQRFAIDLRGRAAFVSGGRDFTPLFDALGASSNDYLTAMNSDQVRPSGTGRVNNVPFTGLTNAQAHARIGFEAAIAMQAARYVRFRVGIGVAYQQAHLLTQASQCNASVQASPADPRACPDGAGLWNPLSRPVIDFPGQRFLLDGELSFDLFAAAMGQF